jgi:hypothetical protein
MTRSGPPAWEMGRGINPYHKKTSMLQNVTQALEFGFLETT